MLAPRRHGNCSLSIAKLRKSGNAMCVSGPLRAGTSGVRKAELEFFTSLGATSRFLLSIASFVVPGRATVRATIDSVRDVHCTITHSEFRVHCCIAFLLRFLGCKA